MQYTNDEIKTAFIRYYKTLYDVKIDVPKVNQLGNTFANLQILKQRLIWINLLALEDYKKFKKGLKKIKTKRAKKNDTRK